MTNDILEQIKAGEVSGVQFKERALDKYDIGCELVAFSNARGGKLVVGVSDKTGQINALSYSEVQENNKPPKRHRLRKCRSIYSDKCGHCSS